MFDPYGTERTVNEHVSMVYGSYARSCFGGPRGLPKPRERWPSGLADGRICRRCAAMVRGSRCLRAAWLVKVYQQALAESGHAPGLEVGGDVPGRHGRPGSAGSPGDGVDRADDLAGVKGRKSRAGTHPGTA